jgi:hypothetical protein
MGLHKLLKKRGVKVGRVLHNWTEVEEKQLVKLWEQGLSTPAIADKFNGTRTFCAIKSRLCRLRGRGLIR